MKEHEPVKLLSDKLLRMYKENNLNFRKIEIKFKGQGGENA